MNTTFAEHPPVPQVLQEALKDYPELIAELQSGLQTVGRNPEMTKAQLTDQFESATWVLDGVLEKATVEAAAQLRTLEAQGDREKTELSKLKLAQLDHCYTVTRRQGVRELRPFFE